MPLQGGAPRQCGKQHSHKAVEELGGSLVALVPLLVVLVLIVAVLCGAELPVGRTDLLELDLGLLDLVGVLVRVPAPQQVRQLPSQWTWACTRMMEDGVGLVSA